MSDLTRIHIDHAKLRDARKNAREGKGFTQEEAASLVGVQKAAISKIECGQGNPSAELLIRLCALYEADISSLTTEAQVA